MTRRRLFVLGSLSLSLLSPEILFVDGFTNRAILGKCNEIQKPKLSKSSPCGNVASGWRLPSRVVQKALVLEQTGPTFESIVTNSDVWVFILGVFPFAWATLEFWRRIMFGEAFGTGSDQIVIGMDDSPSDSRGRRILGRGALVTAYCLFAISFATLAVVLYAVISSSPPDTLPAVPDTRGQNGFDVIVGNLR